MGGEMTIKLVDGFAIRNMIDPSFGSIHRHGTELAKPGVRWYIPEGEVWVDHIYAKSGELEFLLQMDEAGDKYIEKNPEGDYRTFLKGFCEKGVPPDFYKSTIVVNGNSVVKVDGAIVRKYLDPEFIMGGHEFVYDYVPQSEIWLDAWLDERELPYVLNHEQLERNFMKDGMSYDDAHEYATASEKAMRVKDGVGNYLGYAGMDWRNKTNKEIVSKFYVGN